MIVNETEYTMTGSYIDTELGNELSVSGLNLVGGRLLVTASYPETVRAVMSQSNWRFRTRGSVLDEEEW